MITVWSVITVIFENEFLEISRFEKLLLNFAVFFDKDDLDFLLDHVVELVELVEAVDWKKNLFDLSSLRCENLFFDSTNRKNLKIKILIVLEVNLEVIWDQVNLDDPKNNKFSLSSFGVNRGQVDCCILKVHFEVIWGK